jgi:hypothetical protein
MKYIRLVSLITFYIFGVFNITCEPINNKQLLFFQYKDLVIQVYRNSSYCSFKDGDYTVEIDICNRSDPEYGKYQVLDKETGFTLENYYNTDGKTRNFRQYIGSQKQIYNNIGFLEYYEVSEFEATDRRIVRILFTSYSDCYICISITANNEKNESIYIKNEQYFEMQGYDKVWKKGGKEDFVKTLIEGSSGNEIQKWKQETDQIIKNIKMN